MARDTYLRLQYLMIFAGSVCSYGRGTDAVLSSFHTACFHRSRPEDEISKKAA